MIVVGGTQQGSTGVDTGFNYSTDGMDIVYAPGRSVQVSASGCTADGTSFAAPAVSNLIARVLAANPNATVAHVTRAFMNAYMVKGYKLPTVSDVTAQLAGNCSYSISPASGSFGATGGSDGVTVTTSAGCSWTAVSNASWIAISHGSSGSGNGTLGYWVDANTGPQRSGTITIAGLTFTVTQAGVIGVTGTWNGTLSMPGANFSGCNAQTISFYLDLTEGSNSNVAGSTSNGRTITSGSRSGDSITVTLSTMFGARGPYVWSWDGANTITGSMPYFCYDLGTGALQAESTETFTVVR